MNCHFAETLFLPKYEPPGCVVLKKEGRKNNAYY
jgi:hypothetical protein